MTREQQATAMIVFFGASILFPAVLLIVQFVIPPLRYRPLTRKRVIEAITYISLIIHGIFGITVVIDYSNLTFSKLTVAFMLISCCFSLIYNVLTTVLLRDKLIAVNANESWVANAALAVISGLKIPSFILVAYISTQDAANPNFTRSLFLTSLGQTAKTITLVGNQVYLVFLLYSCFRYGMFVMSSLAKKKSKLKLDNSLKLHFYIGYGTVIVTVFTLTFMIPLTSTVTVHLLAFHLWMDENFIKGIRGENDESSKSRKKPTSKIGAFIKSKGAESRLGLKSKGLDVQSSLKSKDSRGARDQIDVINTRSSSINAKPVANEAPLVKNSPTSSGG